VGAADVRWRWTANSDVDRTRRLGFGQDSGAVFR